MSRRITIATKMDREDLVEESLEELNAVFTQSGDSFQINEVDGQKLRYGGAGVDLEKGEAFFDSDCRTSREFLEGKLPQTYNKNLYMDKARLEGHQIDEVFTASAGTHIEGFEDLIEEGDIVIRARASF